MVLENNTDLTTGSIKTDQNNEENMLPILYATFEVAIALIFCIGSILNTIMVIVFFRRRGFRSHLSNRFLMNLVLANLLSGFIFLPIFVLTDILEFQYMQGGMRMCSIMRGISTLISTASVLSQFLICADQYLAVLYPLNYHRHINELRCKLLCISVWIISTCLSIANACNVTGLDLFQSCNSQTLWDDDSSKNYHHFQRSRSTYSWILTLVIVSLAFIIPIMVMSVMYLRIFMAARTNSINTRRNSSCSMTFEGVHQIKKNNNNTLIVNNNGGRVTGKFLSVSNNNLERSSSLKSNGAGSHLFQFTSSLRASMRSKLSHASNLLLYSEESRAAKVTVFVLMALAFCWVPYFSMILVNLFVDNGPPKWANFLGIICGLSNSAISPILYAFRSKRVQRDVKKALGLFSSRRKSSRHVLRKRITKENKNQLEQNFREIDFTKKLHSKIKRVKSLSCPQLLVSSVGENESSTTCTLSSTSKTFQDQKIICDGDNEEHQPMLLAKMFFKNCWSDLPKPPINETKPDVML